MRRQLALPLLALVVLSACQSTQSELGGLAAMPPLDYAVMVTGGAFLVADAEQPGTFHRPDAEVGAAGAQGSEPIGIDEVAGILEQGRVFRRVAVDPDAFHRRAMAGQPATPGPNAELQGFLQSARDDGFDYVLVLEELQDGPIEEQGVNSRWPVTFATWILLGVGALIPDHTFESRATLRVSVRDLQTGSTVYDQLLTGGAIDLALTERTDVLGLLTSILVPPFWVGNDRDSVADSVQTVTRRRLLLSLARDLKSVLVRQRLRERSAAEMSLEDGPDGPELRVSARESLSAVRLRSDPPLSEDEIASFSTALLASLQHDDTGFRYRASLPETRRGQLVQVLVATIRGSVASATFTPGEQE